MTKFVIAAAAALLALPVVAQETEVKMADVPAAAMEAAKANAKGVTFDKVMMDNDEGTATYEFSGKMTNGMMLEVDVLEDGTVEEIEEQIEASALPAEVTATLEKELAGFVPTMVEMSTREGGMVVYEFTGTVDGKDIDAEINADGTNFMMNDDLAR